ncbi:MAG TPA: CidA/LrgA family protein [Firmicutes bacterium]|nr:CidA/LrgA family protein [Bacillota bacterium]
MGAVQVRGLATILLFELAGEVFVSLTGIPFPGRVLGLLLLWISLCKGWVAEESIESAADFLLQNLTLFFTPIVVGAMVYREVLTAHWFAISLSLFLSTAVGLLVTGKAAQRLDKVGSR